MASLVREPGYLQVVAGKIKRRVLVADDNPTALSAMVSTLALEFDVVAASADGHSALADVKRLKPAVAVLDLSMPGLNGLDLCREIRRELPQCVMVMCTVETDPEVVA